MTDKEIEQYISAIIYCSGLSIHAQKPELDRELCDNIVKAIKYIIK